MAEKRLIDANDAVKAVTDIYCGTAGYRARERLWQAVEAIKQVPTVDAVEVVRCMDCAYWDKAKSNKKGFLICPASGMEITADDFCSYGERKDNG